jgi:hypothetical protein
MMSVVLSCCEFVHGARYHHCRQRASRIRKVSTYLSPMSLPIQNYLVQHIPPLLVLLSLEGGVSPSTVASSPLGDIDHPVTTLHLPNISIMSGGFIFILVYWCSPHYRTSTRGSFELQVSQSEWWRKI